MDEIPSVFGRIFRRKNFLRGVLSFCACLGMFCFYAWIYISVLHLETPKHAGLRKEYEELHSRMNILRLRVEDVEATLEQLNIRDNDIYRSVFGLEPVSEEVRRAGYGGTDRFDYLATGDFSGVLTSTQKYINTVNKMAYVQSKSLDDVKQLSGRLGEMASCVPIIYPVFKERVQVSSSFGYREDPVSHAYFKMHAGIDLSGKRGQPVFVTGDGVVKEAGRVFSGYGNTVLVDHGFGYMTRYAHLDAILVSCGQKVTRGEQIATLGNTGHTNGPHLHYEVIYRGRHMNPKNYMNNEMTDQEYSAMVKLKEVPKMNRRKANERKRLRK